MKIAIQGELGSFSHEAAETMLPSAKVVPCARSLEVFDRIRNGSVEGAVIPIENSLAGSVAEHFDLLLSRDVHIVREFRLRIVHNLIAMPKTKFQDVRRVFSHPVALDQCRDLFARNRLLRSEPFYDTAGSVKHVLAEKLSDAAAIARIRFPSRFLTVVALLFPATAIRHLLEINSSHSHMPSGVQWPRPHPQVHRRRRSPPP